MSTNEDLHHKREQNGDEELTSMLQRYLDNSCSNISGSMGKNKAIETGIKFIDRPSGSYNICTARPRVKQILVPGKKMFILKTVHHDS